MVSFTDVMIGIINTLLVPLIFLDTVTDVTIGFLCSNQRYDRCYRLVPTLRLVLSIFGPVTDVTTGVLSSWPRFIF